MELLTGLSVRVAGIILRAELDDEAKTIVISQSGESMNGHAADIGEARRRLERMAMRVRPGYAIEPPKPRRAGPSKEQQQGWSGV